MRSRLPLALVSVSISVLACSGVDASGTSTDTTTSSTSTTTSTSNSTSVTTPAPVWGVTVDDVAQLPDIVASLDALSVRPTARVVFDKELGPNDYADPVQQIHVVSDVLGELVDSSDVAAVPLDAYTQRAGDYMDALGDDVDIWEIGNEINGDPWLGPTSEVVPKMTAAFDAAKARNKTTALTLYYNQDCWDQPDHEMFAWTEANVPEDMKSGLDYVLVSFYEDDCNGIQPDWPSVFEKLGEMFPNSKIGFGECGTVVDGQKATYVDRYYRMKLDHPRYIGGYFWWYFAEDMVPVSQPLWHTLDDAISWK